MPHNDNADCGMTSECEQFLPGRGHRRWLLALLWLMLGHAAMAQLPLPLANPNLGDIREIRIVRQAAATQIDLSGEFSEIGGVPRAPLAALPVNGTPVATVTIITSDEPENSQPHQVYRVTVNVTGGGNPVANEQVTVEDDLGALCTAFLDSAGNGACELVPDRCDLLQWLRDGGLRRNALNMLRLPARSAIMQLSKEQPWSPHEFVQQTGRDCVKSLV